MAEAQECPRNPIMNRSQVPQAKGKTRDQDGVLEVFNHLTNSWCKAVRLADIRERLLEAENPDQYERGKESGLDCLDRASFLVKDKAFAFQREHRPPILFQLKPPEGERGNRPTAWLLDEGRIVLDGWDHPIRDFPELPKCLSSAIGGYDINYYWRQNQYITMYDLLGRMPYGYHDKDQSGKFHDGLPRYGTIGMRATRFRLIAGLVSWTKREGSTIKNQKLLDILPESCKHPLANSTQSFRDLTVAEQKSVEQKGSKPSKARKANRESRSSLGKKPKVKKPSRNDLDDDVFSEWNSEADEEEEPWVDTQEDDEEIEAVAIESDEDMSSSDGSDSDEDDVEDLTPIEKSSTAQTSLVSSPKTGTKRKRISPQVNIKRSRTSRGSRLEKDQASKRHAVKSEPKPRSKRTREPSIIDLEETRETSNVDVEESRETSIVDLEESSSDDDRIKDIEDIVRHEEFIFGPIFSPPKITSKPTDYRYIPLTRKHGATVKDLDSIQEAVELTREDFRERIGFPPPVTNLVVEHDSYSTQHLRLQEFFATIGPANKLPFPAPELYRLPAWIGAWQNWKILDDRGRELQARILKRREEDSKKI